MAFAAIRIAPRPNARAWRACACARGSCNFDGPLSPPNSPTPNLAREKPRSEKFLPPESRGNCSRKGGINDLSVSVHTCGHVSTVVSRINFSEARIRRSRFFRRFFRATSSPRRDLELTLAPLPRYIAPGTRRRRLNSPCISPYLGFRARSDCRRELDDLGGNGRAGRVFEIYCERLAE